MPIASLLPLTLRHRNAFTDSPGLSSASSEARRLAQRLLESHGSETLLSEALDFVRSLTRQHIARSGAFLEISGVETPPEISKLPPRYGVKGGAARSALGRTLGIRTHRVRDIDLIRQGNHFLAEDELVARDAMPDDYLRGARVELVREKNRYFATRDLTINEVMYLDGVLSVSFLGLLDSIGHTLRPSRYRGGSIHRPPDLSGRIALKMARLRGEALVDGVSWCIVGLPEQCAFSELDLAVHLGKAFQNGTDAAEEFVRTCVILGMLPERPKPLLAALLDVEHLRHGENSPLKYVPKTVWAEVTSARLHT